MSKVFSTAAVVLAGALVLLGVPFLWLATEAPASPVCGFIDAGMIVTAPDPHVARDGRLSEEQSFYASVIVSEVLRRNLPVRAAEIAIATAIVESGLRNPTQDRSDLDSSGLFQQRASIYTTINPRDPVQATNAFLDRLEAFPGWEQQPLWWVAAEIQRPREDLRQRYGEHMPATQGIVSALWDRAGELPACGAGEVLAGDYTLPLAREHFERNPSWLTAAHHSYPAIDVPVSSGTPVFAVTNGVVAQVISDGRCGEGILLAGDDGIEYLYCHATAVMAPVGAPVRVGDLIMTSGWSGRVIPPGPAGAHLHLQMRIGRTGPLVCPQLAMEAWSEGRAVDPRLLPTSCCVS
jgi:murein DD-endopeptidase MepM/ murein hydrolase activator NlpD